MKNPPNKPEKSNGYTVSGLLKYIDHVLDDVAHQSRNLYVDKYIRTELAAAYHKTKKYVEKIRAECPGIKDVPADSTDPKEYLRNAHTWCVGQLFWENGERIGAEKTPDKPAEVPAGTEQGCLQKIIEILKKWQESEKTQKDLEEVKQALSPLSETHEILCKGKDFSRKTKKALQWLDMVADGKEGFCRALLNKLASPEVIADLEKWQEKPAETEQKDEGSRIMVTARTSKENWEAIESEYGISKRDFGKKINFVSDLFKRKIIFRDVEHAFVLASQGFSKPALILAGGVIEELLRLYLEHKNIKPKKKQFFAYIEACEDKGLLKRRVSRLTDSIRDFRNLVHLDNEETKRHTVSKATAKGAVASIFTIANDF